MEQKTGPYPHADLLVTPRQDIAERDPEIMPVKLLESQHLRTCKAVFETSDQTFDDVVEAGRSVARVVRDTLWFRALGEGDPPISPESIAEQQATNCHGYSIVMSECLESIGAPHYVSYANNHSFILLLDDDQSRKAFILAGADKKFYTEASMAISGQAPFDQLNAGRPFAENGLYTTDLVEKAGQVLDDNLVLKHPWLSFRREGATRFLETEGQVRLLDKVQMRTYRPEEGRQVLSAYVRLQTLLRPKRIDVDSLREATQVMLSMEGVFPEMDQRNKYYLPTKLRKELVKHKLYDEAVAIAEAFDKSRTHDNEATFFLPDTLRQIGAMTSDSSRLAAAIEKYDVPVIQQCLRMRADKQAKARQNLSRLRATDQ